MLCSFFLPYSSLKIEFGNTQRYLGVTSNNVAISLIESLIFLYIYLFFISNINAILSMNLCYTVTWFSIFLVPPPIRTFIIKHYNGLCITLRSSDNRLRLSQQCTDRFTLTSDKNLKHVTTGKCAAPESLNNDSRLKLMSDCSNVRTQFEQTSGLSMRHILTGKCVHPFHGSINPTSDTDVVIYTGCDEDRLQFKFIWGKLYCWRNTALVTICC